MKHYRVLLLDEIVGSVYVEAESAVEAKRVALDSVDVDWSEGCQYSDPKVAEVVELDEGGDDLAVAIPRV